MQDFRCTNNDHVFLEAFIPSILVPKIGTKGSKNVANVGI
jgi:hypothetical protein